MHTKVSTHTRTHTHTYARWSQEWNRKKLTHEIRYQKRALSIERDRESKKTYFPCSDLFRRCIINLPRTRALRSFCHWYSQHFFFFFFFLFSYETFNVNMNPSFWNEIDNFEIRQRTCLGFHFSKYWNPKQSQLIKNDLHLPPCLCNSIFTYNSKKIINIHKTVIEVRFKAYTRLPCNRRYTEGLKIQR